MIRGTRLFIFLAALAAVSAVTAVQPAMAIRPDEVLADSRLEARARAIGSELRCLVCQNESIDESDADLAHDLRVLVRQRLVAGDSDDQVKAYIVARYGDYVLLKPPFKLETLLLWGGPLILLLCALAAGAAFYRRGASETAPASLTAREQDRLAALLGGPQDGNGSN